MELDINEINDSPHLLDILIQMENVLDSSDIYVFDNWLNGKVVDGPNVGRYWVDFALMYDIDKMPDERGAKRLMNQNIRVNYDKVRYGTDNTEVPTEETEYDKDMKWLIRISIPRSLIVQIDDAQHEFYDDEIDINQVEDAKDDGMDEETAFERPDA